ncbi:putative NUDIX family phosphoesterase [Roseateles asaccharophilus]|uniref:hypothetical protein n=1 Tax=Roseateles asaccharophilus TaxID=582607 RepID=UPI00383570A7
MTTTQAAPIKVALCVRTEDTPFREVLGLTAMSIPPEFFKASTSLRGRHEAECCENDPAWKQLLPYVVAIDEQGDIYCYTRGKAGAEGRLHGNISIGLGGHVDEAPVNEPLIELLEREANRELEEEAKLPAAALKFRALICDPTNDVGMVHIGILAIRHVSAAEKAGMLAETGVVEKGGFVSLSYLRAQENFGRLENWSKVAVDFVDGYLQALSRGKAMLAA